MSNRIVSNAKWIIGCRIVQSVIQFLIGLLTVRYLGPAHYGLIDYAASLEAFAIPVMELGLQSTLVQEYVASPEKEGQILGTHLVMNLISAIGCMAAIISFAALANPGDRTAIVVCALYSITLLSRAVEMLRYWFQAKLLSKYSSVAMLCAYVILSVYKVYLLVSGKSIFWFALSHAVEYGSTGIILLFLYKKCGTQKMQFSFPMARKLFSKSRHYIMAMLMVVVYSRVANILLKQMIGETENGYYAAAVTCTAIFGFVFMAVIDTARPVVLESRRQSLFVFEKNITRVYSMIIWMTLSQAVVFTVFAKLIITVLYGEAYLPAVPVLQILVWNTVFSYLSEVRNVWILGEEKHKLLWIINFCGVIVSVGLNGWLIPLWGACGAAVACVLVQIFTNVIMGYILEPIRRNNRLMIRGLNPKYIFELLPLLKK